jgi:TetR/AcrR family transcriptional repressor of bet genes
LGSAAGDPITEIEVFIDFHLGLGADSDSEALACWILLSDEALRDREIRVELHEALAAMAARLEDTIQRGIEQKAFACQAVGAAASGLMAVIQGYFVLAATARTTIPKGSAARSTRQMAEGLLRPARPFSASKGKP